MALLISSALIEARRAVEKGNDDTQKQDCARDGRIKKELAARRQRRFLGPGAHVLVHYGRSAQEAESLVAAIQTKGGRANAISADSSTSAIMRPQNDSG